MTLSPQQRMALRSALRHARCVHCKRIPTGRLAALGRRFGITRQAVMKYARCGE